MKIPLSLIFLLILLVLTSTAEAQKRHPAPKAKFTPKPQTSRVTGNSAVVIDETLAVLRVRPSLFAETVQRMRRGRKVQIADERQADGVTFYRVSAAPNNFGWVQ